jgi:hypothetical protein
MLVAGFRMSFSILLPAILGKSPKEEYLAKRVRGDPF